MNSPAITPESNMSERRLVSPCTGLCKIEVGKEWCQGCYRTLAEISRWGNASVAEQHVIWVALLQRKTSLQPPAIFPAAPPSCSTV